MNKTYAAYAERKARVHGLRDQERLLRFAAQTRGERTYMPARPCKHHPDAPRLVAWSYRGACAECVRLKALNQKFAADDLKLAVAHDIQLRRDLGDLY